MVLGGTVSVGLHVMVKYACMSFSNLPPPIPESVCNPITPWATSRPKLNVDTYHWSMEPNETRNGDLL